VLPADKVKQLMEVCEYVKHDAENLETDTFGKQTLGNGLGILFFGLPGTGKTMTAEVIAKELKLSLHIIDLSKVISKYIGETEKNLDTLFDEAEDCKAILFFDEADALFGKRSEVKDAHDRYANQEVDYLLNRVEKYRGIVILAINAKENVDNIFVRRFQFVIDFPLTNKQSRCKIWEKMLDNNTNFSQIDFESISLLPLSGGKINSIILIARSLAGENSGKIEANQIIEAIVRFLVNSKLSEYTGVKTDLDLMLIELFAYLGDELSKLQDAVAKEAYLDSSHNIKDSRRKKILKT
jgi:SpoVK/Ycf46/Vps4 family AAA+-type ATPase